MQRLDLLALIMTVLLLVLGLTKADMPASQADDQRAMSVESDTAAVGMITTAAKLGN